jgi:hypothetical protein
MHILHSIAIVYIQVYEFLHEFVVENLGNTSQVDRSGHQPGQPASQPAGPACRPVNRIGNRLVRSAVRLDRPVRQIAQFFA